MARGYYLVIQDKTTCGGVIIEGEPTHTIMGKAVARERDRVTCGVFPGIYIIVGHIPGDAVLGRKFAGTLHSQSSCPCQARLIPSMTNDTYEFTASSAGSSSAATSGASAPVVAVSPASPSSFTEAPPAVPDVIPVFAKSCLRGSGCTDAGTDKEPHTNFASMAFY